MGRTGKWGTPTRPHHNFPLLNPTPARPRTCSPQLTVAYPTGDTRDTDERREHGEHSKKEKLAPLAHPTISSTCPRHNPRLHTRRGTDGKMGNTHSPTPRFSPARPTPARPLQPRVAHLGNARDTDGDTGGRMGERGHGKTDRRTGTRGTHARRGKHSKKRKPRSMVRVKSKR